MGFSRTFLFGAFIAAAVLTTACGVSQAPATTPESPKEAPKASVPAKLTVPAKFLLVGDSLMIEGFGPEMEKAVAARDGFSAVRLGVYSTGLNRVDFFDWGAKTEELIRQNSPDAVIVIFGANDGQGITDEQGHDHQVGTPGWSETYAKHVDAYLARVSPLVKKVYWVGHPMPLTEKWLHKVNALNPVFEAEAAKFPNVVFVNNWNTFSANGKPVRTLADEKGKQGILRNGGDGIHPSEFGGRIMAKVVLDAIEKDIAH